MDLTDMFGNVASDGAVAASLYGASVATMGRRVHVVTTRSGSSIHFQYVLFKPLGLYEIELLVNNALSSRFTVQLVTGVAVVSAATISTGPAGLTYPAGTNVPISIYFNDQFGNTGAFTSGQTMVTITHTASEYPCAGPSLTSDQTVNATILATGFGTAVYIAQTSAITVAGTYSVSVTVAGAMVTASSQFTVGAGPSNTTTSTVSLRVSSSVAGVTNRAVVTLKDTYGNRVAAFEPVTTLLRSPTDTWPYSSTSPIDLPIGTVPPLVAQACEDSVAEITCAVGSVIHIVEANFGRVKDGSVCPH